jgi:hypothetical protein
MEQHRIPRNDMPLQPGHHANVRITPDPNQAILVSRTALYPSMYMSGGMPAQHKTTQLPSLLDDQTGGRWRFTCFTYQSQCAATDSHRAVVRSTEGSST